MNISKELLLFWAKKEKDGSYHPLVCHSLDAGFVAQAIWNYTVPLSIKNLASKQIGVPVGSLANLIGFWVSLHDFGKATPTFQNKWAERGQKLRDAGFAFHSVLHDGYHGMYTTKLLPEEENLFSSVILSREFANYLATTLGGHHGIFSRSDDILALYLEGKDKWIRVRKELFDLLKTVFRVSTLSLSKNPPISFWMRLAGLTSFSDWIASNTAFFPFQGDNVDKYEEISKSRAASVIRTDLRWKKLETPSDIIEIEKIYSHCKFLYPAQKEALKLAESFFTQQPGIALFEAPMSEGKTEAALILADRWMYNLQQQGLYYALPTKATSNSMFQRMEPLVSARYGTQALNLLHSNARNQSKVWSINPSGISDEGLKGDNRIASWFTYRKRGLLSPLGVGTVDQLLMSVLQTKHFFVRQYGLANKTVIIDEVHAYDVYMSVLLELAIEWLASMGCSVILLSATLPKEKRLNLIDAYRRGLGLPKPVKISHVSYPRMIYLNSETSGAVHFSEVLKKHVRVCWVKSKDVNSKIKVHLEKGGGNILDIRSTVAKAQNEYQNMKSDFPNVEISLLHARYPLDERDVIERRIIDKYSRDSTNRPKISILASTQIVEQSLDLDFDLIISDMAPIDLILQRVGRLWRHQRIFRGSFMLPEIWILLPELNEDVPDFGKSITAVYEKYLLLRSWLELGAGKDKTLRIPACISRSVDRVYGKYEYKISDALKKVMSDSKKKFEEKLRSHKAEAESKIIFSPNYGDNPFEFFNSNLEEDSNSESRTLKALTRLSAPSVSVVLLHESNGKLYLEPTYKTEVPNDVSKIDSELSGKMLQKVVNISHKTVAKELFDENNVISLHFDKEHAMFGNRTITLRNNTTIIGGCLVKYSPELGVIIKDLRT